MRERNSSVTIAISGSTGIQKDGLTARALISRSSSEPVPNSRWRVSSDQF